MFRWLWRLSARRRQPNDFDTWHSLSAARRRVRFGSALWSGIDPPPHPPCQGPALECWPTSEISERLSMGGSLHLAPLASCVAFGRQVMWGFY